MKSYSTNSKIWIAILFFLSVVAHATSQETMFGEREIPPIGIKTNLPCYAAATPNLGVEFRLGKRASLDLLVSWNPFVFGDNRKWKHVLFQPEWRFWIDKTYTGHFFGAHAHYAYYNVGNLPKPFSAQMREHRFDGWLSGMGASYGYRRNFGKNEAVSRWSMEVTIGVGYVHLEYGKYECAVCGEKLGNETKNFFVPTKAGIILIYSFGGTPHRQDQTKQRTDIY